MKTISVAAAVIRNEKKDKIFATARGYGEFKGQWEFPGGKIEEGETPEQALIREIIEELETDIEVGELIDTIEYDYPNFHLSMKCYWAQVVDGELVLKEAEDSKWLSVDELESVNWLPADLALISKIKANMLVRRMFNRKKSVEKINIEFIEKEWGIDLPNSNDGKAVVKWCYADVLYSFKSIYLLGMKAFNNNLIEVCGLTLRPREIANKRSLAYCEDFITKHIDECGDLNKCQELQDFISLYETRGNVIPIWPGGNVHKGQFWCYDNPDIYFNDPKIIDQANYFFKTKNMSCMIGGNSVIDGKYKDLTTEKYINMDKLAYLEYLKHHVLEVITNRKEKLELLKG